MFRKILYPADFSPVSLRALEYVKKLSEAGAEEVILLHVVDERKLEAMIEGCLMRNESVKECEKETKEGMFSKARGELRKLARELESSGLRTQIVVVEGNPSREIARVAGEEEVSLIVMGTHGRSVLREAFVGSVAENVVHYTTVPVLLVRGR